MKICLMSWLLIRIHFLLIVKKIHAWFWETAPIFEIYLYRTTQFTTLLFESEGWNEGGRGSLFSSEYRKVFPFELSGIHASRSQLDEANSNFAMGFLEDFQIFIVGIHRNISQVEYANFAGMLTGVISFYLLILLIDIRPQKMYVII